MKKYKKTEYCLDKICFELSRKIISNSTSDINVDEMIKENVANCIPIIIRDIIDEAKKLSKKTKLLCFDSGKTIIIDNTINSDNNDIALTEWLYEKTSVAIETEYIIKNTKPCNEYMITFDGAPSKSKCVNIEVCDEGYDCSYNFYFVPVAEVSEEEVEAVILRFPQDHTIWTYQNKDYLIALSEQ